MKKHNILGKTIMCIIAAGISAILAAGCGSNTSTAGSTDQTAGKTTQSTRSQSNADARKNQMQSNIDALVTAGTITKDQGDKIIAALTANRPERGNGKNTQQSGSRQGNDKNVQASSGQGSTQNGGQPQRGNNPLSKLVSDGTITQAQADAVIQGMRKNAPQGDRQNTSNTQNGSSQSTTSK